MVVDRLFIDLIVRTAQLTKGLSGAMSSSLSWASSYGSKVASIIRKSLLVGIAGLGLLIGAAIGSGVSQASELQHQMSGVQAVLQETDATTQRLKDHVMELAVDPQLKVSAAEAAAAMEMLARNGLKAEEILGGAERATILLSNATGGDMANSADIATDAMALFNKTAGEMESVVDSIVGVTSNSKLSLESYKYALAGVGGVAATMGVSLEDMNTALALASPAFADGSTLGNGFKSFLNQLIPTTKSATEAFSEFGFMIDGQNVFFDATTGNMKDMAEVTQILHDALGDLSEEDLSAALKKMFGARGQIFAAQLVKSTAADFQDLAARVNEAGIASVNAALRIDNLSGDMEIFKSIASGLAIQLGDALLPYLRAAVQMGSELLAAYGPALIGAFSAFIEIITYYTEAIANGYPITDAFLDALYELGIITQGNYASLLNFITGIQSLFAQVSTAVAPIIQWVMSFVQLRDVLTVVAIVILASVVPAIISMIVAVAPFIIAIGALILIVATLRTAWETNFAGIRDFTAQIFTAIQVAWMAFQSLLSGDWNNFLFRMQIAWAMAWQAITTFLGNIWSMIEPYLTALYTSIYTWVTTTDWGAVWNTIVTYAAIAMGMLWGFVEPKLIELYNSFMAWVTGTDWLAVGRQIVERVSNALDAFSSVVSPKLSQWYSAFTTWVAGVDWRAIGRTAVDRIIQAYDQFVSLVGPKLNEWYQAFLTWVNGVDWYAMMTTVPHDAGEALGEFLALAVNKLAEWASLFFNWVAGVDWASIGQTIVEAIVAIVATLGAVAVASLSGFYGVVEGFITNLDWRGVGMAIINGIKAGASAVVGALIGTVTGAAQSAIDAAKALLGIASPSKVFDAIGSDMMQGWINKVVERGKELAQRMRKVTERVIEAVKPAKIKKDFTEFGRNLISNWIGGIEDEEATLYDKIKSVASALGSFSNNVTSRYKDEVLDPLKETIDEREDTLKLAQSMVKDMLGDEVFKDPQAVADAYLNALSNGQMDVAATIKAMWNAQNDLNKANNEYLEQNERLLELQKKQEQFKFLQSQLDLMNQLREAGLNPAEVLNGFALGLDASLPDMVDAMSAAMQALIEQANKELGVASPSKVFDAIGRFTGQGLEGGLLSQVGRIARAGMAAGRAAVSGLQAAMTGAIPLAGSDSGEASSVTNEYSYNNYGSSPRDPRDWFAQQDRLAGLT